MTALTIKDRRSVPDVAAIAPAGVAGPAETFILALRSGASVEEAERVGEMLLRFQEKEEAREAERVFNASFASAMTEMPAIPKDAKATRGNAGTFWYSKLETILSKAQPVLGRHGLHLSFSVSSPDGKTVRVAAIVRGASGHSIREELTSPVVSFSPANTPLQNLEGTVTALKRTLGQSILGLAVGGEEEAAPYVSREPELQQEEPDVEPILEKIYAAQSAEELRALKPEIAKIPAGPARVGVIKASAARIQQLEGVG